jgi:uncharacterized DUF497 family protein
MMLHDSFEWDQDKAQKNLKKHGVSFEDAALVLADEEGDRFHVEEYDAPAKITRIISARVANPAERRRYAKEIGGQ